MNEYAKEMARTKFSRFVNRSYSTLIWIERIFVGDIRSRILDNISAHISTHYPEILMCILYTKSVLHFRNGRELCLEIHIAYTLFKKHKHTKIHK